MAFPQLTFTAALVWFAALTSLSAQTRLGVPAGFDLQGHRGARGLMPEDTIPAMLEALRLGVTTLELDVVISKDGQVVVSHDAYMNSIFTLDPTGNAFAKEQELNYLLYQMDYELIRQFDVGLKGNPSFPAQQRFAVSKPLLADLIDAAEAYATAHALPPPRYNIETKSTDGYDGVWQPAPAEFVQRLMAVVNTKGIAARTTIQSFDPRTLRAMRAAHPDATLSLLVSNSNPASVDENLATLGFTPAIYSPDYRLVNADLVARCRALGLKVLPWTTNSVEVMHQMIALGVDGLITDYPNLLATLAADPRLLVFHAFNAAAGPYADAGGLGATGVPAGSFQQPGAPGSGVSGRPHDRAWDASANTTRGAGTPANDSRVTANADLSALTAFTLVFWYRLEQPLDDAMRFISQANALSSPTRGFFVRALNNRLQIFVGNGSTSLGVASSSFAAGSGFNRTGEWVFAAITWDGVQLSFYTADAQGQVAPAGSGTFTGPWAAASGPLVIGNAGSFNRGIDGLIDNVRLYDAALVASELTVLAREDLRGLNPNFSAWLDHQGLSGEASDRNANGVADLLEYALGREPGDNPAAPALACALTEPDSAPRTCALTFDFVYSATDLEYTVEGSSNLEAWAPLLTLDPHLAPYHAYGAGPRSLSATDGVAAQPGVVALENLGYVARVTVRDAASLAPARFYRLRVTAHDSAAN